MIRLVCTLHRCSGSSESDFFRYWRDEHGPRVAALQSKLKLARYVQTHRDADALQSDEMARALRGGMAPTADGVADFWWPSIEVLQEVLKSAEVRTHLQSLANSELQIVDPLRSSLWLAHEYPQVATSALRVVARPRTGMVKLVLALNALPASNDDAARHYWLTRHGPLVRSHAAARGMSAYVQVHRLDTPLADDLRRLFGYSAAPFLGHAEAWFDRLVVRAGPEADQARSASIDDERRFIDLSRSMLFSGKEHVFVDREWSI